MANGSGNPELEAVLRLHKAHQQKRAKPYAAVFWILAVDYHDTEDEAREALAAMPVGRRAAIVERPTGDTWVSGVNFQPVMDLLRNQEHTAPDQFRRQGTLGNLKKGPMRRRGT